MPPRKSDIAKAATVAPSTKDSSPLPQAAQPARATSVPEGPESVEKAAAAAGGHPHTSQKSSGINLEDLNLPKSIVTRLAKENLPTGTAIQATALLGIQKSATVFINYLANQANEYAQSASRKTVSPADVLKAIEEVGFGEWKGQLEEELRRFEANAKAKREKSKGGKVEEGDKEDRPRKKLKGHKGEDEAHEEPVDMDDEEEHEQRQDGEEGEEEEGDEAEEDDEDREEEQDQDGGDEDEEDEDEQLRVRGKSEDEALDNGEDSD